MKGILGTYQNRLMRGVAFQGPELNGFGSFAAPAGGQGGTAPAGGEGGELGSTTQHPLITENNDGSEEDGDADIKDILSAFGTGDDSDADDDAPVNIGDIPQDQVDAMQQQVSQLISQIRVPDNMIPENFDPNDRTQLQTLLNKTAQAAVSQSMGVVFKPVQLAMTQMAAQMQAMVDNKINASNRNSRDANIIEDMVPEINNPKYSAMVKGIDATLKSSGKKPQERAKTLRKMLNQMGITEGAGQAGNRRQSTGGGGQGGQPSIKQGKAALDSFFGAMPSFK